MGSRSRSFLLVVALALGAASGCSILTDLDGLSTPLTSTADATAPESGADAPNDSRVVDASDGGLAICRPGLTGEGCRTSCPAGRAGLACDYELAFALDIPRTAEWNVASDVPYETKPSGPTSALRRVGYRFALDSDEVWVEMDAFTQDATKLGVPVDDLFREKVENVRVFSFSPRLSHMLEPTQGNIEFWSHCYGEGSDGDYDDDDAITQSEPDCYGSMQVHVAGSTVFAFNRWSEGGGFLDVGIGKNLKAGESDWTFARNAATFQNRRLEVYVLR